jgi:hypothetical protein
MDGGVIASVIEMMGVPERSDDGMESKEVTNNEMSVRVL